MPLFSRFLKMDSQMDNSPDSRIYIEDLDGGAVITEHSNPTLSKNDCTVLVKKDDFVGLPGQNYHILPFPPEMQSVMIGTRDGRAQSGKTSVKNVLSLPSKFSIPGGLAQVFVGGSMVICGAFALRYQNYFFYYGSGLWAGTLAGISGIVNLMATRKGMKHPRWLCGGFRRRIAVFLTAIVASLLASVAAAILSTSGLIQDSQYDYSKQPVETSLESEIYDSRKSSGILINALLLLLSLLQILLTFGSLGIALRVYFANRYGNLLQSGSDKSEVTEVVGNGEVHEYEAKKDRLLCWLGHQRPQFFTGNHHHSKPKRATTFREVTGQPPMRVHRSASARVPAPVLVAVLPPPHCQTAVLPQPHPPMPFLIPAGSLPRGFPPFSLPQYVFPQPMMVPLATLPRSRQPRSVTPVSLPAGNGKGYRRKYRRDRDLQRDMPDDQTKSSSSVRSDPVPEEPEITEEEVGKTYTGLDRVIAEEFISSTMSRH